MSLAAVVVAVVAVVAVVVVAVVAVVAVVERAQPLPVFHKQNWPRRAQGLPLSRRHLLIGNWLRSTP
jgi:hypothetical protein